MKAVHFGAGNIGRGFIGLLLSQSGYDLTFVDISDELVRNLNHYQRYQVFSLGAKKTEETVTGIRAICLNDSDALNEAVKDADLITLSIGANHLQSTGKILKDALAERQRKNPEAPLDMIACENALFATDMLKESIEEGADAEFRGYLNEKVGFPNCAVDRIVPNAVVKKKSPVDVAVEEFYEWDIESKKVKANRQIFGAHYVEHLAPYLKRKIFLLNGAHALVSYIGFQKQYRFVHEAIKDPDILSEVHEFHWEASEALHREYGMERDDLEQYSEKIAGRFRNPYLKDELTRVGRDPVRKLSENDRLVSPLKMCEKYDIPTEGISLAIAAGLAYKNQDDPAAVKIQTAIAEKGLESAIQWVTGLAENSESNQKIAKKYREIINFSRLSSVFVIK